MNEKLLTAALDKALLRCTEETGLVGGAVNIVRGGKTVYTYEYGYSDRENKIPMTQDTMFDVASTSKAWTVMLAAQAIDAGLATWDEPIQKHIPWFTMVDSYAGSHLSIRDMASHRTGLPGHDFLREKISGDRENLMRKTAYLEPNVGFRTTYQYNNHMFILLGYVVEQLRNGKLWEQQIRDQIAKPLGINPIRFRGCKEDMSGIIAALPYGSDGYQSTRCCYASNYHSGPCGGIRISMNNMSKWIAAMSRGGVTPDGGRLCSEEQYAQIIRPVISAPSEDFGYLKNCSYCQAWLNADYKGHNVIFHSGGLSGFVTQVGFLPGEDCGYVMSFNTGTNPGHSVARAIVLDTLIDGQPSSDQDYEDLLQLWIAERDKMHAGVVANAKGTSITKETNPSLIGVYRHPAYETFEIKEEDGQLVFHYGDFSAKLRSEEDGTISGYAGTFDDLKPERIFLYTEPNGDLRLENYDSGGLHILFKREK